VLRSKGVSEIHFSATKNSICKKSKPNTKFINNDSIGGLVGQYEGHP